MNSVVLAEAMHTRMAKWFYRAGRCSNWLVLKQCPWLICYFQYHPWRSFSSSFYRRRWWLWRSLVIHQWSDCLIGFETSLFTTQKLLPLNLRRSTWWLRRQRICLQCKTPGFDPWVGKNRWRRAWQPTPVFLPGESYGQRSLVGYSQWGRKESDMTLLSSRKNIQTSVSSFWNYFLLNEFMTYHLKHANHKK